MIIYSKQQLRKEMNVLAELIKRYGGEPTLSMAHDYMCLELDRRRILKIKKELSEWSQ